MAPTLLAGRRRVRARGGDPGRLGGVTRVIDAPDDATALDLAAAGSTACNRRVEVRRFLEG